MRSQKLKDTTITDYTGALEPLEPIYRPPDIGSYEDRYGVQLSEKVGKAVGKLLQYVKVRHASTKFLGYDHELWRVQFAALKAAAEESDDVSRVKDLTTTEIKAGYQRLTGDVRPFYVFLLYTGMRAAQAYDVLKTWNDKKVEEYSAEVDGVIVKYCRYATSDVSRGKKMSYYAYFPAALREQIRTYTPPTALGTMTRNIREQATTDPARPINVSNLRKYAVNMLRKGKAADWDVAEYIQGRRPKGVGQARYLSLGDLANEQYPIALHRNMPDLIPLKSQTKTQRGPAKGSKQEGGDKQKPVDYAKVKRMLKAGKTHREIIAETGINKTRLSEYLKEHPELRRRGEEPVITQGDDLQGLYLKHKEGFRVWCKKTRSGIIIRPSGHEYYEYPPKIEYILKTTPHITMPQDLPPTDRKQIAALQKFFDFLKKAEVKNPLGLTYSAWKNGLINVRR